MLNLKFKGKRKWFASLSLNFNNTLNLILMLIEDQSKVINNELIILRLLKHAFKGNLFLS